MRPHEAAALLHFLDTAAVARSSVNRYWCPKVTRWARLRLPNGQVARSHWKECLKPLGKVRTARNVKVIYSIMLENTCLLTLQYFTN